MPSQFQKPVIKAEGAEHSGLRSSPTTQSTGFWGATRRAGTAEYYVDVALEGAMTRGSSRRWQSDSLRLAVGMPEPQGKKVQVMEQVDNARL